MKNTLLTTLLFVMVITLSSCGGGGGGATGGNPSTGASSLILTITPVETTLPANTVGFPAFVGSPFLTQVSVRVTFENGQDVPTGTIVHLQTNNASILSVSAPDDAETTEINEFSDLFTGLNQETLGAIATYFVKSGGQLGTAELTANATHPTTARNHSVKLNFTVTDGPEPIEQLLAVPTKSNLPANINGTPFFSGTPFMIEADIQVKDVFGNFTEPATIGTTSGSEGRPVVKVSVNPTNIIYLTKNDDVTTQNVNEFLTEVSPAEVNINAGHGNLFLWSKNVPGIATVSLSTIEPGSGFEITHSFDVEVVTGVDQSLPSDIVLVQDSGAIYATGSGGDSSLGLHYTVTSGDFLVLDPQVNNIQLSIVTDGPSSGESLRATNVNGTAVQGTTIRIASVSGLANALVHSGSDSNTIILTSTVDGEDNNVDNGIQQPISTSSTIVVSDGILWALELASPALDSLTVNAENDEEGSIDFQDGTYSLVISAIATDKGGNPALPQTLQFGMINSPITGYPNAGSGSFVLSGVNGNPQEGGRTFTSSSGSFLTAAGGVQLSDTLVVFGEDSLGNEDLESAVTVASINSESNLTIVEKFNRNDGTGVINNDFGVLPYAIGRAVDGNITATALINENGVATTRLNYPVSQLGRIAAIFVKGQGSVTNSVIRTVTDVELITFPGVEGFNDQNSTLVVSPNIIPGNISNVGFVVCLADSARNPLPGRSISFSYVGGNGQGNIDGQSGSGIMTQRTGLDGCATGSATTTGVIPGANANNIGFNFFSGGLTCETTNGLGDTACIQVAPPSNGVLNANPSSFIGRGGLQITLTLYDGSGQPISGASISGTCEQVNGGSLGIIAGPTVTNSNGQSTVTVSVSLDAVGGALNGTCTFATASGDPSVEVNFTGGDACSLGLGVLPSPVPPAGSCTSTSTDFSVSGTITGIVGGTAISLQNNGADTLNLNGNIGFTFPLQTDNSAYNISVSTQPVGQTCTVTNGSGNISGAHVTNVMVTCL